MTETSQAELLSAVKDELYEIRRPRLLFDIAPSKKPWLNVYDVTLKNVGGSPAYHISCVFRPDLPYGDTTLSQLPIFRSLHHLAQGDEISFFFESAFKLLDDPNLAAQTIATITYEDSKKNRFVEPFEVDLGRYRNIRYIDEKNVGDLVQEVKKIERTLDRIQRTGLLTKTIADVKREERKLIKRFKQVHPSKK